MNGQQIVPEQIIASRQRGRDRRRPRVVLRDQIRHPPVARGESAALEAGLVNLEPDVAGRRVAAAGGAGAFGHPDGHGADGVRPGVPVGGDLGAGGDGPGEGGGGAIGVALHRGQGWVLDGVVAVPFLCASAASACLFKGKL